MTTNDKPKDVINGARAVVAYSRARLVLARVGLNEIECSVQSEWQYEIKQAVERLDCAIDDLDRVIDRIKSPELRSGGGSWC